MKKLILLSIILVVGCEDQDTITTNAVGDGTAVTDTLYVIDTLHVIDTLSTDYSTCVLFYDDDQLMCTEGLTENECNGYYNQPVYPQHIFWINNSSCNDLNYTYPFLPCSHFEFDNISLLYNCEIDWYLKITQWLCTTDYESDEIWGIVPKDTEYDSLEECEADCPVDQQSIGDEYYTKFCIEDLPD